jgi:hypothetical protein
VFHGAAVFHAFVAESTAMLSILFSVKTENQRHEISCFYGRENEDCGLLRIFSDEDGSDKVFRNVGDNLQDYTAP